MPVVTEAPAQSADVVQREPLKTAEAMPSHEEKPEMPVVTEAPAQSADVVQREPLKTAEAMPAHEEKSGMPVVTEAPAPSADVVRREPLKTAEAIQPHEEKPEMPVVTETPAPSADVVQREPLKTAEPVRAHEEKTVMPVISESEKTGVVQREPLKTAEPVNDTAKKNGTLSTANTVMRESASSTDDLSSLLSSLPTHYEMPKEQVEAIRSGSSYTAGQNEATVQREPADTGKPGKGSSTGKNAKAASRSGTVQRESDFALPHSLAGRKAGTGKSSSTVQREFDQTNQGRKTADNSRPNSFPADRGSFPEQSEPDTIQREIAAPESSGVTADANESAADTSTANEAAVKETIEKAIPEVTPRQLDALAEKLLPRIKRIIRAETERSIFR